MIEFTQPYLVMTLGSESESLLHGVVKEHYPGLIAFADTNSAQLNTNENSSRSNLRIVAITCVAIALFVAPFPSSAGLRAGFFVLAALLILFSPQWPLALTEWRLHRGLRLATWAIALWVLYVGLMSFSGPAPKESLSSWRGDVLTPVLAGLVMFALARTRLAVGVWLFVLLITVLILGYALLTEFLNVTPDPKAKSWYIGIGWLTAWIVLLAPLLPLAWGVAWPRRQIAQVAGIVACSGILVSAWLTTNRIVWVCFALMLCLYLFVEIRVRQSLHRKAILVFCLGIVLMLAGFIAISVQRANMYPDQRENVVEFMLNDNRLMIWREAVSFIREAPMLGHGYGLDRTKDTFSARFSDPWAQSIFKQAHNVFLNYAIQFGITGPLVLLILFGALGYAFGCKCGAREPGNVFAICGLMLITAFLVRNMLDDFFLRHTMLLFGALIGMLLAMTYSPAPFLSAKRHQDENSDSQA